MADVADDAYPSGKMANKIIQDLRKAKTSGKPFFITAGFTSHTCLLMHLKILGFI